MSVVDAADQAMTRRRRFAFAVTTLIGVFVFYEGVTSIVAYTADAYVQSDLVALAPRITGRIIALHVKDNDNVVQGDLLATIDPVPFELAADQTKAEVTKPVLKWRRSGHGGRGPGHAGERCLGSRLCP